MLICDLVEVADKITWLFGLTVKSLLAVCHPTPLVPLSREKRPEGLQREHWRLIEVALICKRKVPVFCREYMGGRGTTVSGMVAWIQPNFCVCCFQEAQSSLLSVMRAVIMDYLTYSLCL